MKISLEVNGQARSVEVEGRTLLVEVLREKLGLTGTHVGCDTTQCGCCTVLVDGQGVKSCTMLAGQADGCRITTVEGLGAQGLHPVQVAFTECHALQCGFCTPGMIMAVTALLERHPQPTDEQILEGLAGNLCRCTGYANIIAAVKQAANAMAGSAA
jgi:carbon-monoxide dehydrogenase small subunit